MIWLGSETQNSSKPEHNIHAFLNLMRTNYKQIDQTSNVLQEKYYINYIWSLRDLRLKQNKTWIKFWSVYTIKLCVK